MYKVRSFSQKEKLFSLAHYKVKPVYMIKLPRSIKQRYLIPLKPPRWHPALKQPIQLLKTPMRRLGHPEINPQHAQPRRAPKDEADLAAEIRGVGVDEQRDHDVHEHAEGVLDYDAEPDGAGAEPRGRDFREERPADGADG